MLVTIGASMKGRVRTRTPIATLAICILLSAACGKKYKPAAQNPPAPHKAAAVPVQVGHTEQGVASWYGIPYHGRAAADGEIYDMETLVAAHRTMPFNTWVRVTNVANGKSVSVRIIDRGPFVEGRIIDLSKAAARQIDLLGPGIGQVRLEVIGPPVDVPATDFYGVQVGAFSSFESAERVRVQYAQRFGTAQIAVKQGNTPLWRVLVGRERSQEAAQQLANQLSAAGTVNFFVVRLDAAKVDSRGVGIPVAPPPASLPPPASAPQRQPPE